MILRQHARFPYNRGLLHVDPAVPLKVHPLNKGQTSLSQRLSSNFPNKYRREFLVCQSLSTWHGQQGLLKEAAQSQNSNGNPPPAAKSEVIPYDVVPLQVEHIIGHSSQVKKMANHVEHAINDTNHEPVLITGEQGLYKTKLVSMIHHLMFPPSNISILTSPPCRPISEPHTPLVRIDVSIPEGQDLALQLLTMSPEVSTALPPTFLPPQVKSALPPAFLPPEIAHVVTPNANNGLLLTNIDRTSPQFLSILTSLLKDTSRCAALPFRLFLLAQHTVPALSALVHNVINVPSLRSRPTDIQDNIDYLLTTRLHDRSPVPVILTVHALTHLQAYNFPGNLEELEHLLENAVNNHVRNPLFKIQTAIRGLPECIELCERDFWDATNAADAYRWNITSSPLVQALLRSGIWPDKINAVTQWAYLGILALLFWGPQDREHNVALTVFWAGWWPLVFLSFPILGRIWCSVCPFMIWGQVVQGWREQLSSSGILPLPPLRKWPKEIIEQGPWFLFTLFAGILVWEEVWDLPNTAYLSSWLLVLITVGAVSCSLVFEKRIWCHYLCPIGGMTGMFSKLSMTEIRGRQQVCKAAGCSGVCRKGSYDHHHHHHHGPTHTDRDHVPAHHIHAHAYVPTPSLGTFTMVFDIPGCSMNESPAIHHDNHNCVMCMRCLKLCPNDSAQLRVRPPLYDLWAGNHRGSAAEVALMYMLLGAVYLHRLPELQLQLGLPADWAHASTAGHILISLLVMAVPGAVAFAADKAAAAMLLPTLNTTTATLSAGNATTTPTATSTSTLLPSSNTTSASLSAGSATTTHAASELSTLNTTTATLSTGSSTAPPPAPLLPTFNTSTAALSAENATAPPSATPAASLLPTATTTTTAIPFTPTTTPTPLSPTYTHPVTPPSSPSLLTTSSSPTTPTTVTQPTALSANFSVNFVDLSYGLMPLVWAATLAHYEPIMFTELGNVLPITALMLGMDSDGVPGIALAPRYIAWAQEFTLLMGAATSAVLTARIGRKDAIVRLVPQCVVIGLVTAELWRLMV